MSTTPARASQGVAILVDASGREEQPGPCRPGAGQKNKRPRFNKTVISLDPFERAWAEAFSRAARFVARHPRRIGSGVVVALAGLAATAFGIAPLTHTDADLPSRIVTENVTPDGIDAQLEALAAHELELYRNDLTRSADTADSLLRRLNVDDAEAASFIRSDSIARRLLSGRAGKMVQVRTDASGELDELVARYAADRTDQFATHFTRLRIARVDGRLKASVETAPL